MKSWLLAEGLTEEDRIFGPPRKLSDLIPETNDISNSAWKCLRWLVAQNRSHISQVENEDELVEGIPKNYRQCTFVYYLAHFSDNHTNLNINASYSSSRSWVP